MKKISILLKTTADESLKDLLQTPYYKIYNLVEQWYEKPKNISNRIVFLEYKNKNERKSIIKSLIANNPRELIIPYFRWDIQSKYAIFAWNQYSSHNVDWKTFRHKNKMNEFIGNEKKSFFIPYNELWSHNYDSIKNHLWWENFIIKPINRSASAWAFKIQSQENWDNISSKLLHSDHVVEEYYPGHLHSVDFYFDGENILILCAVKEMPFIEILDENKFSDTFFSMYWEDIQKHFLYSLPIRYDIPYSRLHDEERKFIYSLWSKLKNIWYKWFIHLEYKFDTKTKKVWFIEWWARMWWQRIDWIKKLHYFDIKSLLYDIHSNDISKWKKYKWCYIFKETVADMHYVWIYKNFLKKTHIWDILTWYKNYMQVSFYDYIINYFKSIGIIINNLHIVKNSYSNNFYPTYQGKSSFKILFEVNDENFKKLREKKIGIIEKLIF